jgi:YVTN family beta-propeller protein
MGLLRNSRSWIIGGLFGYVLLALGFSTLQHAGAAPPNAPVPAIGITAFTQPTTSSPIAMSEDNNHIWVVNPDNDTVSIINAQTDQVIGKIIVGHEPQSVALGTITGGNYRAYVAAAADNKVTVINATTSGTFTFDRNLVTGSEPWNVVASPNGNRIFVANSGQDTITVIRNDITPPAIIGSFNLRGSACNDPDRNRHFQPRGMAITADNTKLYVTRFLSFTGGATPKQGTDNGKVGLVCQLTVNTTSTTIAGALTAPTSLTLAAQDTGFADAGTNPTKAFPNQMQSIVVHGTRAYMPNIAASPSGPLKFNVDTQAFVSMLDLATPTPTDAGAINLHLGARIPETGKTKLFFSNPWAIAFDGPAAGNAYVVSAGSDLLVKLTVDGAGVLAFTGGASTTRYIDLHNPTDPKTSGANAGKNPLGIVVRNIAPGNNKAYVMNYLSRNVSVVNLDSDVVDKVVALENLPTPDSDAEQIQVGAEMFFSSRGVFDGGKFNRLSAEGWQACSSCHFAGLTDGIVWTFNAGPRKSVALNGTFNPHNTDDQRVLNYSAIFDEVQDFEANIRNVSGPGNLSAGPPAVLDPNHGLLIGDNGDINAAPGVVNSFALPNSGRPQLKVTLPNSTKAWPALDSLNVWVREGIRTPNGALTTAELPVGNNTVGLIASDVAAGRALFFKAGCQTCHGGGKWTNSARDFIPPPVGATTEATPAPPVGVNPVLAQYLPPFLLNISSFNLGVTGGTNPIGSNVGAIEKATDGKDALGADHNLDGIGTGYNVPSLLGISAVPPYYHNGSCETLACVLGNVTHRTANNTRTDVLTNPLDQARVVAFLESLDTETLPANNLFVKSHDIFIEPAAPIAGVTTVVGVNLSVFGPNISFVTPITVKFNLYKLGNSTPVATAEQTLGGFTRDFGQEVVSTNLAMPSNPGFYRLEVIADSNNVFAEDRENDNSARRTIFLRSPPPDLTAPTVSNVKINNGDAVTSSRDVTISFDAVDPPSPTGQTTSGLESFCVVRYSYNVAQRRWVEETCTFSPLPTPTGSTFSVTTRLPVREGTAYAFVWVRDNAGNISRVPGFDVISFIPAGDINIARNDVRVFRIFLAAGQTLNFTASPTFGDVDVSVFQGISNPVRCAVSASNGTTVEAVTVPGGTCTGTVFQIEVRAVVNSRFTIGVVQNLIANIVVQPAAVGPEKDVSDIALVDGPPAAQAAISDAAEIDLPLIVK